MVRQKSYLSRFSTIHAGVPQGRVIGPLLYLIFTSDLPTDSKVFTFTYADDTAILFSHSNPKEASKKLQNHLLLIEQWLLKWRIRVNENKSTHVTFTLRRGNCPHIKINNKFIPQKNEVNYLGVHLDKRLTWKKHIETKRMQAKLKLIN